MLNLCYKRLEEEIFYKYYNLMTSSTNNYMNNFHNMASYNHMDVYNILLFHLQNNLPMTYNL